MSYWWYETDPGADPWFQYSGDGRPPLFTHPLSPIDRFLKAILKSGIGPQELALRLATRRMYRREANS